MSQEAVFDDASIPVLTEVVDDTPLDEALPADVAPESHVVEEPAPAAETALAPEAAPAPAALAPEPGSAQAAPEPEPEVETEKVIAAVAALAEPEPEAVAQPAPSDAQLETRAIDSWTAQQWDQLERRLCERILQQLQGRVDFVLEQRLRDSMAEVLQHAVSGLTTEIREGLQQTIEKIVVRAVSQELAHLQTLKK